MTTSVLRTAQHRPLATHTPRVQVITPVVKIVHTVRKAYINPVRHLLTRGV